MVTQATTSIARDLLPARVLNPQCRQIMLFDRILDSRKQHGHSIGHLYSLILAFELIAFIPTSSS